MLSRANARHCSRTCAVSEGFAPLLMAFCSIGSPWQSHPGKNLEGGQFGRSCRWACAQADKDSGAILDGAALLDLVAQDGVLEDLVERMAYAAAYAPR